MAKNFKGGYKIVSLKGIDLVGESLALADLYNALKDSYDKPILLSDIVIDGEAKKNALVQVEVTDDGIKINDVYGYDILVEEDGDIVVTANPQELPNTADASAGQVLKLDAQKKPVWGDEAEELPDTADASQGNALLLDAEKKPVWGSVSGGTKLYKHVIKYHNEGSTYDRIYMFTTSSSPVANIYTLPYVIDTAISYRLDRRAILDVKSNSLVVAEYNSTSQEYEIKEITYNQDTFEDAVTEL